MSGRFSLDGRVALVTGSSRGIGYGIAEALAEAGAHVVLNGRDGSSLDRAVAILRKAGRQVSAIGFDATNPAAVRRAVDAIVGAHGRLDVAVANAGTTVRKSLLSLMPDDIRFQMEINVESCLHLAQAAAAHMIGRGAGRIILVASFIGPRARPNIPAYVASKAAVRGLTAALAVELGPKGITCNAIGPGYTMSDAHAGASNDDAWVAQRIPLGRWGTPRDMGGAVVFLASDAGSYCNGQTLVIDGGISVNT
jgi:gluconate 5-dehydrogenase